MRILYYNWIPFNKKHNTGGGVNVYQNNLINSFEKKTGYELFFLSSGIHYSFFNKKAQIIETTKGDAACRTFEFYNSPIIAPAAGMNDFKQFLYDEVTYRELKNFITEYGPFDVLHYNNIEGLSGKCLEIKRDFPKMKVLYSLHNYFLFCPNGYLFFNNSENCFGKAMQCEICCKNAVSSKKFEFFYKVDNLCMKLNAESIAPKIKSVGKNINSRIHKNENYKNDYIDDNNGNKSAFDFEEFRIKNVDRLNKYVDYILAVSDRVREIAVAYGVRPEKVFTNYIGTKFAESAMTHPHERDNHDGITIAYMGFLKKEKGIEFLCDALKKFDAEHGKKLSFKCYARNKGTEYELNLIRKIESLQQVLHKVEYHNGYTHDELPRIMKSIDVGVVPVIWEDNLPQVAIEFAANGVPVLTSNLGGANELSDSPYFVYDSSSQESLIAKLYSIIDNPALMQDYYAQFNQLTTMDEHIEKLVYYYQS